MTCQPSPSTVPPSDPTHTADAGPPAPPPAPAATSALLEHLHDAVIAIDAQQRVTYFNQAAEHQYGIAAREALGRPLHTVYRFRWLQPEDEAAATAALASVGWWRGENLHVRRDGATLRVESMVSVVQDDAGGPSGLLAVIRDITARTQAEAALRASEERLRLVLESVQDYAIFTLDTAGHITSWNAGAQRVKGYTADAIVGQSAERFYAAADVAAGIPAQELAQARRAGRAEAEGWRVRQDGSQFWANEIMTPLVAADGTPLGFTKICRDVTARKQAEDAVARALAVEQAARAEAEAALATRAHFLSIASHELRTPLTSLIAYAYLLSQATTQGSGAAASLSERIMQQGHRLNGLIEQLLDVSRLERGRFALDRQAVDLGALVAATVDAVQATLPAATTQRITQHGPDAPLIVDADGARLEQALTNLLTNAVKYSPSGSAITVTVMRQAHTAVLEVADRGIGIPHDAQTQVFAPFYRAPNVGATSSGFGLGLYIVREIVARHGGTIAIESAEGQGTTVRVVLPFAPPAAAASDADTP